MKTDFRLKENRYLVLYGVVLVGLILIGLVVRRSLVSKPDWERNCSAENNESQEGERYLAIGFDDFRDSDFAMVIPLFNEYGHMQHLIGFHITHIFQIMIIYKLVQFWKVEMN